MIETEMTIINRLGLHARAAAKLVAEASRFSCHVFLVKDGREVNAKSIMGVMMLAAAKGSRVTLRTDGVDEAEARDAILRLVNDRFGEDQ